MDQYWKELFLSPNSHCGTVQKSEGGGGGGQIVVSWVELVSTVQGGGHNMAPLLKLEG